MDHRLYVKIWCHTNRLSIIDAATFNLDMVKGRELTGSGENCLQWTEEAVSGFVKKNYVFKNWSGLLHFQNWLYQNWSWFFNCPIIFFKKCAVHSIITLFRITTDPGFSILRIGFIKTKIGFKSEIGFIKPEPVCDGLFSVCVKPETVRIKPGTIYIKPEPVCIEPEPGFIKPELVYIETELVFSIVLLLIN